VVKINPSFTFTELFFLISEKPQEEKKDTFTEKLATQVIKNLQVKITSIHIRYEDDVSVDSKYVFSYVQF